MIDALRLGGRSRDAYARALYVSATLDEVATGRRIGHYEDVAMVVLL